MSNERLDEQGLTRLIELLAKELEGYATLEDLKNISNGLLNVGIFANALKGNSTGEIVSITDVSPLEHEIDVKVKGKNLVGIPNIVPNMEENKFISIPCYITEPIVISGVNDNAVIQDSSGNPRDIWRMQVVHQSGLKELMMDSNFATGRKYTKASTSNPIIEIQYRSTYLVSGQYKDIQVEYGDVATSYAPHIPDLSAVNVISHGKNLFDISKIENTKTITNNGDGSLSVTTYANPVGKTFGELCPDLKVGSTITLSANTTGNTFVFLLAPANLTVTFGKPVVVTQDILDSVLSVYGKSPTEEDMSAVIKDIQVEYGNTVTEYEPYEEPTVYPVNADGTGDGVKSVYPRTVLATDTTGAIMTCTYNKDINKAFAELRNALVSLGGNV